MHLRLRPLLLEDEEEFRAAHEAMAPEGFVFGLWLDNATSWKSYVEERAEERRGRAAPGRVPSTFLVAVVDGRIVGRASIRHALNDFLAREGGHIGFGVLKEYRRRGYATEMLRQSLIIAAAEGLDRVLVTCDDENAASAAVIERCGGVVESVVQGSDGIPKRRYWIELSPRDRPLSIGSE